MFVAIKECSAGNEFSGANWVESNIFSDDAPLSDVFNWSRGISTGCGRLMLSRPQNSEQEESPATDRQQSKAAEPSEILPLIQEAIEEIDAFRPHFALDALKKVRAKLLPC